MKTTFSVLIIFVLSLNTAVAFAGDDEKTIVNVIEQEYLAFWEKDLDTWADYWVHEPSVTMLWIGSMGYSFVTSFDSLKVLTQQRMENNNTDGPKVDKKVTDMSISEDLATVFLDERYVYQFAGEEWGMLMKSKYVLKKVDDQWKFLSMTTFNETSYENTDLLSEYRINNEGYQLLNRNELEKAIKVFELNTQLYPDAFNTWDSLAEAYMKKGEDEKAIRFYKKSLELNPRNDHAKEMLGELEK